MKYTRDPNHQYSEFYTNKVSKHFSLPLTNAFLTMGWSANAVTYLMWITGILGGVCLLSPVWELRFLGCFLMFMINILDTSDGEVARFRETCSPFGMLLDKAVHFTTNQLIYSSFFIGLYLYDGFFGWLVMAILLNLVTTSDEILKEMFTRMIGAANTESKQAKLQISYNKDSLVQRLLHVVYGSTGFYHLFVIFVIADVLVAESLGYRFLFETLYVISYFVVNSAKLVIRYRVVKKKLEVL